jgi:hypothetical protein
MGSRFINGAKYAVSTSLGAAVAVTALTNADPAVATTATPPADGAVVLLASGWTELNESVVRADSPTANSFALEGFDASDAVRFPAGEGIGAYRTVGGFVTLSQVRDVATEGGDQNYFTYQYVEDQGGRQRQKPTFKSPMTTTITLDYDPNLPWYDTMRELDRTKNVVVLRETLPNGDVIYYVGALSFNGVPSKSINENMTVTATFSLQADPIRYAAA